MSKRKKILSFLVAAMMMASLTACSSGSNDVGDDTTKMNSVVSSNVSVTLDEYEDEQISRYYVSDIPIEDSEISETLTAEPIAFETAEEMEAALSNKIELYKEKALALGDFSDITSSTNETNITINGTPAESQTVQLAVSIFTDGGVQINFASRFGKAIGTDMDAEKISKQLQQYAGIKVTPDDIKALQNKIFEVAKKGSYNFVVSDAEGMNGFYITVSAYGTDAEEWQVFTQRYVAIQEDESSSDNETPVDETATTSNTPEEVVPDAN